MRPFERGDEIRALVIVAIAAAASATASACAALTCFEDCGEGAGAATAGAGSSSSSGSSSGSSSASSGGGEGGTGATGGGAAGAGGGCGDLRSDPKNCGACGHDCAGASCSEGVCQPLCIAKFEAPVITVGVGGDVVYAVTDTPATLWRFDANGDESMDVPAGAESTDIPDALGFVTVSPDGVAFYAPQGVENIYRCDGTPLDCVEWVDVAQPGHANGMVFIGDRLWWVHSEAPELYSYNENRSLPVSEAILPRQSIPAHSLATDGTKLAWSVFVDPGCIASVGVDEALGNPGQMNVMCGQVERYPSGIAVAPNGDVFFRAGMIGSVQAFKSSRLDPIAENLKANGPFGGIVADEKWVWFDARAPNANQLAGESLWRCPHDADLADDCVELGSGTKGNIESIAMNADAVFYAQGDCVWRVRR